MQSVSLYCYLVIEILERFAVKKGVDRDAEVCHA